MGLSGLFIALLSVANTNMALKDDLLTVLPKEESGSKTSRKYDFQKNLSLYLMIEYYGRRDDFVFLFDFHDDLAVVDSEKAPNHIEFYQIKSKDKGNWTINRLSKAKKNQKHSIIGKLYLNKINFEKHATQLIFISNANFNIGKLNDGRQTTDLKKIRAKDLQKVNISTFNNRIKKEHKLKSDPRFEDLTRFEVTKLSNEDSQTHCIGAINILVNKINPNNKVNSGLAYKQIINEVKRKTNTTVSDTSIVDLSELFESKGISKSTFLDFLNEAGLYSNINDDWNDIQLSLRQSTLGYGELQKFKAGWRSLNLIYIGESHNSLFQDTIEKVRTLLNEEYRNGKISDTMNLKSVVENCYAKIKIKEYDEYFIKCLIIKCFHEKYQKS